MDGSLDEAGDDDGGLGLEGGAVPDLPGDGVHGVEQVLLHAVASPQPVIGVLRRRAAHHPRLQVLGRHVPAQA